MSHVVGVADQSASHQLRCSVRGNSSTPRQGPQELAPNLKPRQESLTGRGGEKPLDTEAATQAMIQARKELGPDATVKQVMKRRDEILGGRITRAEDVGAKLRAANPEPTRAEVKAAQLKRAKGRR